MAVAHEISGAKTNSRFVVARQQTSSASTNIPVTPVATRNENEEDVLPVRLYMVPIHCLLLLNVGHSRCLEQRKAFGGH